MGKVFRSVKKVFKAVRVFNFLKNLNPWVALGVFAVGWLFSRSRKPDTPDYGTTDFEQHKDKCYLFLMFL